MVPRALVSPLGVLTCVAFPQLSITLGPATQVQMQSINPLREVSMILRAISVCVVAVQIFLMACVSAHALPFTSIDHLNNFRDTRGLNDVGIGQGDSIQFGADVVPNGLQGTTMSAVQGARTLSPSVCNALAVDPNFCARSVAFSPSLNGSWALAFQNGSDTATAVTPVLGAAAASPAPFPLNVTISGSGFTPTLSWTVPSGFVPDAVRVNIYDKTAPSLPNGMKDVVHSQALPGSATTFVVPTTLNSGQSLKAGNSYVLNVQFIETAGHAPLVGGNFNDNIVRRSSSFFDFTPLTASAPPKVLLPTVGPAPDPSTGRGPAYEFHVGAVRAGETIFVDPSVAVGYQYAIGAGNPKFASVSLPNVGDGLFDLSFALGADTIEHSLAANTQFFFPSGGVDAFTVAGIETSAGLDPLNVTAFVTGLSFVADGDFTGTMTPLLEEVPTATPEPATLLLWGTTMAGLGIARSRRSK